MLTNLIGQTIPINIGLDCNLTRLKCIIERDTGVKSIHQDLFLLDGGVLLEDKFSKDSDILLISKIPEPINLEIYLLDGSNISLVDFDRLNSLETLFKIIKLEYDKKYGYELECFIFYLFHEKKIEIIDTVQLQEGDILYLVLQDKLCH